MKPKAEPCLRDYLTIHVPASTLMGDRLKKRKDSEQPMNPLMNKKLQVHHRKSDVAIVYSTLSNKSFGKKKKMETIPLLSNLKLNQDCKLRILKDPKKAEYNFIFQKSKPKNEATENEHLLEQSTRPIATSHSNKKLARSLHSQSTRRQSTAPFGLNQIMHRKYSSTSYQFLTQDTANRKIESVRGIELSGFKANIFEQYRHHRQSISQDQVEGDYEKYPQTGIYISH